MKIMPLNTRRSTTCGMPWLFGSEEDQKTDPWTVFPTNGVSRSNCSSVRQKRLRIITPVSSGL
jgi:hypothetical protein